MASSNWFDFRFVDAGKILRYEATLLQAAKHYSDENELKKQLSMYVFRLDQQAMMEEEKARQGEPQNSDSNDSSSGNRMPRAAMRAH